jgi:ATP-dependent exoDNAse (exonuclease V) beta subunit
LHYIAENIQDQLPVHDFIAKGMEQKLEVDFEKWLTSYDISLSFQNIRKKSLYEAVEVVITKFLSPNLAKGGGAYVQYFLDIVLERDVRNQAGISDFLNFWDKNAEKFSIPSPEGNNAVRIMTIHKSKGLEFPVVIMPFAEEDYSRKPKDKLWLDGEEMDFGLPKVLVDNSSAVEGFGIEAKSVYDQKKQEELLDNVNVLYVALTRAEEQLYVISNMNLSRKGEVPKNNMCTFFINYLMNKGVFDANKLQYEFGSATKLSNKAKHVDTSKAIRVVAEVLNPKNIKIAQREALMWGTYQQESIEYGNVVHEILSFVKTKNDIDLAIDKSIESGLITINQKELVYKTIEDIVNHAALESFFSEQHQVLNEQTIIQKEGKTIKPDRMVVTKDKEVYLLDYKTGLHDSKYQKQLENYQSAIELMGYKVVKKVLIYIGKGIDVVNL